MIGLVLYVWGFGCRPLIIPLPQTCTALEHETSGVEGALLRGAGYLASTVDTKIPA